MFSSTEYPYSKPMFFDEFNGQKWHLVMASIVDNRYEYIFEQHEKELIRSVKIYSDLTTPKGKTIFNTTNIVGLCKGIILVSVKYH